MVNVSPHGFCVVNTQLAKLLMLIARDTVSSQLTLALRYPRPLFSYMDKGLIKIIMLTAWRELELLSEKHVFNPKPENGSHTRKLVFRC